MSSSSEEEDNGPHGTDDAPQDESIEISEPDDDTLRVLLSTDNHLGYMENDPVRGMDSFAAFEEVLYLAKMHKTDMVLLAGDLFHMNKPSRRTLHKTIDIIRRYTMGPDPVKIQILSDQEKNFRSMTGAVNYEDQFYSVDLPIFSIHGNHDDPTRDGGGDLLAALDLLAVANLVNYFGRQDEVNKVEVSPVLIQKGGTKLALYGMGSMRDERLNRMWQQKNVRFLRPEGIEDGQQQADDDDDDDDNSDWFNMFVLHQNRDLGRGTKNCIHESYLPSWIDLCVWGHEHSCEILAAESLVGTFRITQPGSSVATSLSAGEAIRKHCAVLDIRRGQFKITPIPLTMVRSFVMHDVQLSNHANLDPEDPKVDDKITKILESELRLCIHNAREKTKELLQDARQQGNNAADEDSNLKYKLEKRDQVLVRLRVEHSGFSTLNNQRFGAKFVGQVANTGDVLLFSRAKAKTVGTSGAKKSKATAALEQPVLPEELQQVSVEDLVADNLETSAQKLELLKEKYLGQALGDFVDKGETHAISQLVEKTIAKRRNALPQNDKQKGEKKNDDEGEEGEGDESDDEHNDNLAKGKGSTTLNDDSDDDENDLDGDAPDKENHGKKRSSRNKKLADRTSKGSASLPKSTVELDSDEEEDMESTQRSKSRGWQSITSTKAKSGNTRRRSGDIRSFAVAKGSQSQASKSAPTSRRRKKPETKDDDDFDDNDSVEVMSVKRTSPRRRTTKARVNYSVDVASDEDEAADSDSDEDMLDDGPPKKAPRKTTSRARSGKGRAKSQDSSIDLDDNWGTASTRTQH